MISRPRRFLALLPIIVSFMLWDIVEDIGPALMGCLLFGTPYWLAWWLSDGFIDIKLGSNFNRWMDLPFGQNTLDHADYARQLQRYIAGQSTDGVYASPPVYRCAPRKY